MSERWRVPRETGDNLAVARRAERLQRGELEALVMDVLWDQDGWLTPGDVHEITERHHPLAYTTVMTILVRLWNKGMVDRRQRGRAFAYHPIATRDEWAALRMREFLSSAGDRAAALSHFVSTMNPKELSALRRVLDRRRRR